MSLAVDPILWCDEGKTIPSCLAAYDRTQPLARQYRLSTHFTCVVMHYLWWYILPAGVVWESIVLRRRIPIVVGVIHTLHTYRSTSYTTTYVWVWHSAVMAQRRIHSSLSCSAPITDGDICLIYMRDSMRLVTRRIYDRDGVCLSGLSWVMRVHVWDELCGGSRVPLVVPLWMRSLDDVVRMCIFADCDLSMCTHDTQSRLVDAWSYEHLSYVRTHHHCHLLLYPS